MSLESKLGRAVLDLGEIVKSNVMSALVRSRTEGQFTMSDADLTTVANCITQQIDNTFKNGIDAVLRLIK